MKVKRHIRQAVWLIAFGYILTWLAATWFIDDGAIIRDSAACARLEEMPLFWACDSMPMTFFANLITIALATTYLAPLVIAAALANPAHWVVALPIATSNLVGIAAVVYAILRLVGWAVRGTSSYLRTGEIRFID